MVEQEDIEFTDELWMRIEDGIVFIGVKQEVLDDINELWGIDLPDEGAEVSPEEICGEIETDQGPINLYSPVEGEVIEVNTSVSGDPDILFDDSTGEGWLLKIEPSDASDLESFLEEEE